MHEKAKYVCFISMQSQKVKFKFVQINMKQVSYNEDLTCTNNEAPQPHSLITAAVFYFKVVILVDLLFGGASIVHGV